MQTHRNQWTGSLKAEPHEGRFTGSPSLPSKVELATYSSRAHSSAQANTLLSKTRSKRQKDFHQPINFFPELGINIYQRYKTHFCMVDIRYFYLDTFLIDWQVLSISFPKATSFIFYPRRRSWKWLGMRAPAGDETNVFCVLSLRL